MSYETKVELKVFLVKDKKEDLYISKFSNIGTFSEKIQFTNLEADALYCNIYSMDSIKKTLKGRDLKMVPIKVLETSPVVSVNLKYLHSMSIEKSLIFRTMKEAINILSSVPQHTEFRGVTFDLEELVIKLRR